MTPEAAAKVQQTLNVPSVDRVDNEAESESDEEQLVEVPYTYQV